MNSKFIIGIYKEVGKNPEFRKIKNTFENFKKILGGEFENVNYYEDFIILYRKNNSHLKPNIWFNNGFFKLGITIRGNILVFSKDDKSNIKSLNEKQLLNCTQLLIRGSFNYKNFDKHGRYIPKSKLTQSKNNGNHMQKNKDNISLPHLTNTNENSQELILKILFTILNFIKNSVDESFDE